MMTPTTRLTAIATSLIVALLALCAPAFAQQGVPLGDPWVEYAGVNGSTPCAGCKLYAYAAGTTTPQDTFSDADLATIHANANPVILSSAGRALVYLSDRAYKLTLTTPSGTEIWTADYVVGRAPPANVLSKTANYSVLTSDGKDVLILVNASGGAVTISPYTAVGNTGRIIRVKKTDSSINTVTIDPSGSQTIDGVATVILSNQYENVAIASDGNNWATLGPVDRSVVPGQCQCRLTLTSGTAITTSNVIGSNHIYLTPYLGTRVSLYNGSAWVQYVLSEVDLNLTNQTVTSGSVYDLFLYLNAGTLTLERLAWTNVTTRATALTTQDGVYVKSGDATRLFVGTFYATNTNATSDSVAQRAVWSHFNRRERPLGFQPTQDSYTYSTATWRQANADTAAKVEWVTGLNESPVRVRYMATSVDSGGNGRSVGIGLDSITAPAGIATGCLIGYAGAGSSVVIPMNASCAVFGGVGYHYAAALEIGNGSTTTTWYGDNGTPTTHQNGMEGTVVQ